MGRAHSNAWGQSGRFFETPLSPHLHTIAARDAEALAAFAERWGWSKWTTEVMDLASDASIDLVDVATPNFLHAEHSIAMLESGKHVACEKPLARTLDEARAMRDAAEKAAANGQRTFVWFNYRRCPAVALAHKMIREGAIGRIYHVRARYLQSWGGAETPMNWRFDKSLAGSGVHGDLNAHSIDLARFLTGEAITEITGATAPTFVPERDDGSGGTASSDVDDCVAFLATMEGGAVASFEASRMATGHLNDNSIEINGEHGSIQFSFEDMNVLWLYETAQQPRTDGWRRIMCTRAGAHPYVGNWWPDGHVIGYEHGFVHMAADILRVLGGEEPEAPLVDFADAYETQRVLEAALVAAERRCAVPLAEIT